MSGAVVAIDGPSGSGKSTVSRAVARALGLEVLDTGAMYRAVTLAALEAGVDPTDGVGVAALAAASRIDQDGPRTRLDGRDVSDAIRGPAVTAAVSTVAAHPAVRAELVARQRAWVDAHGGGVVEGRDIGTVVLPRATVKVFLTASETVRAERRRRDESAAQRPADLDAVQADLERRDRLDSTRAVSPLEPAADAVVVDTDVLDVDAVVQRVLTLVRQGGAHR